MLSVQSAILGLLAASHFLGNGVLAGALLLTKRATDITCGGQYPKAGDGFGKKPDGCSSWSDNPAQVRDQWGSADFRPTCKEHDRCYYTIDSNRDVCNDNFCDGLKRACKHAYCKKIAGVEVCEPVTYGTCRSIGETYCAGVRLVAGSTHEKAQALQKGYEACIRDHVPPPPVLCSDGHPEGATWSRIAGGTRCTKESWTCRDLQIVMTGSLFIRGCIEP